MVAEATSVIPIELGYVALHNSNIGGDEHRTIERHIRQTETAIELTTDDLSRMDALVRALLESTTDGILVTNSSGGVTRFNQQFVDMWNVPRPVIDSNSHRQITKAAGERFDNSGAFCDRVEHICASFLPDAYDLLELSDGRSIERISKAQVIGQRNVGRVWRFRDLSERRRADLASGLLEAMVDSSDDAIVGNDLNGIITKWNTGAQNIYGYTSSEAVGTSIDRLLPAERLDEMNDILTKIKRGERVKHYDTQRVTKDGRLIDVTVTASPIRDTGGKTIGASKVSRDITEQRRLSNALIASEIRYRRLFESAKDGILILDAETGVVVDVNAFLITMLGFSHDEFVGKAIWDLGFFKDILANEENFTKLKEKGYLRYDNLPLQAADGHRIDVEFVSNVYLVNGSRVIQCNVRDVTARRHAEEAVQQLTADLEQRVRDRTVELETTNKELEAFSYSVSHDLRAPLRAVDGFAQAALEDFGPQLPPECQSYLLTIREGTQKMGMLIDDLLRFSRLGRAPLNKQVINTGHLVRSVVENLRSEWAGREIDLRIGELPECAGDLALLKQVWINLISNAAKFTQRCDSAVVEIGCETKPEGKVYFVRDNGTGFDMRYVGKLFGVFQRLHRTEDYEGTGVGLAIVQRIIHRHGGRIWAQAAVDRGATFYFTLE